MKTLAASGGLIIVAAVAMALGGCATEKVFLQGLTVDGPIVEMPVYATTDSMKGSFRIAPRLSYNTRPEKGGRVDGHTLVSYRGLFEVDSSIGPNGMAYTERQGVNTLTFRGSNFTWGLPRYQIGVDLDYTVVRSLAISGTLDYGRTDAGEYAGASLGIALLMHGEHIGGRLEVGLQVRSRTYDVRYVVTRDYVFSSARDVFFFSKHGKMTYADLYGSFTVNSDNPRWPVNMFLSAGLCSQTLMRMDAQGVTWNNDLDVQASLTVLSVTPGFFIDIGSSLRLYGGVRLVATLNAEDESPNYLAMPMAKLEIQF